MLPETTSNHYVEVIVPLALNALFTYHIPDKLAGLPISVGSRVVVPFGPKRFYTAIVASLNPQIPPGREIKDIIQILDTEPIVRRSQLQLWQWMSEYYLCSVGEVYRASIPSGLKLESETFIEASDTFDVSLINSLDNECIEIFSVLQHEGKKISAGRLEKITGDTNIAPKLERLLEAGAVMISERIVERYRTLKVPYVALKAACGVPGETARLFAAVKGAARQEAALMALIEMSGFNRQGTDSPVDVERRELEKRANVSPAIISAMQKRGLVEITYKEKSRFSYNGPVGGDLPVLSEAQSNALRDIASSWHDHDVTLLHGVTSSGKTEIYMHLVNQALNQGRQALMLVPEIALTTQLTTRLQRVFGDKVVIYHSKFSDNERVEIWMRVLHATTPIVVIGARSAIFLPFSMLGLVIVDEEHEPSYKQHDPAPRYNARDCATMLARHHGAKTLFGSATPAIDTYYKAQTGRYGLVTLSERFGGIELPEVITVDTAAESKAGRMNGVFSPQLIQQVNTVLDSGNQSILFLNRRGYAPVAECPHCAYTVKCADCDVTLTYHRAINRLVCHYCGTEYALPTVCPVCHEPGIKVLGYGTERIEEDLERVFQGHKTARMDLDTTRAKEGYDHIIDSFSQGKYDILVGTQMVTKGLDFGNVMAVGVINADAMINLPDFRSGERAFNMLEQVAGRAGRRDGRGIVVVQTRQPDSPLLQSLKAHDYQSHYMRELGSRHQYNYPPFTKLIYIYIKHRDKEAVATLADLYAVRLRELLGNRVYGPDEPDVSRVQTYYIRKIMLKFEVQVSMPRVKEILRNLHASLHTEGIASIRQAVVAYDVDPY